MDSQFLQRYFIFLFTSVALLSCFSSEITQFPNPACVGQNVYVICLLNVPVPSDVFIRPTPEFIFGNLTVSSNSSSPNNFNCTDFLSNTSNNSIEFDYLYNNQVLNDSRFVLTATLGNSSTVYGSINLISYQNTDKALRLGCINYYYENGNCSVVKNVTQTLQLVQRDPPSEITCSVDNTDFDPYTCNLQYGFSWTQISYNTSVDYILLNNNTVLDRISSVQNVSNFSDLISVMPGDKVNFTLMAENCAGTVSSQCFEEIIPSYEFVNGSLNISYPLHDDTFTFFWELQKISANASDRVISLKFRILVKINYKFMNQNISYSNYTDFERDLLSNSTNISESILFNPNGRTLERIDIILNVMIVQHCGYNISGGLYETVFRYSELPNGFRCAVNYDFIYPQTCAVGNRITWTSPTNKLNTESIDYTLYSNNSVFYAISSPDASFTILNDTSVRPREEVNFTLTVANFVGKSSMQCSVDIIPTYEFVNGSLNISYSLQDNNFTYFWDLEKTPGNAPGIVIALKFRINFRINYKFTEHNMSYSQNSGDLERIFFSNSSKATEYFGFNPAGQTLERIDIILDVQIVEHCGYNIGGDRFKALFRFAELPTGVICAGNYEFIDPNTCVVGNRIMWTSPTNKLNSESIDYTLFSNNSVFYAISSPDANFTILNDTSVRPREEVNFTLTAGNFVGQSSAQCSVDTIPTYELINGSLNISYSFQNDTFTYFWNLQKTPGNASDLAIALKFRINFRINYKFMKHNMSYSQNSGDLERIFFSNSTNATESFTFNQVGQTLERIDIFLNVQIVQHCGYNTSGNVSTDLFRYSELPIGFRCAVNYDFIDPQTCAVGNRITWTSPTNKLNTESIDYTLYSNNSVFYAISSPETNFTISNDTSVRPRGEVNFTLTAQNFLAESSIQCSVDIIPTYEFVNGSLNISYSLQDNNFTYFWDLEKTPGNASDLVIALKFRINFRINYKFMEHNMSYSQNSGDLERIFFSNSTNATESFTFNQVGQSLERIDIFLNVQIVQHCGYNTSGNVSTDLFRYSELPIGFRCAVNYDFIYPQTCTVGNRIRWTSPTNKLNTESIDYTLYSNNSVFYAVSSPDANFTILNDTSVRPREEVNFTLTAQNFLAESSIQCSVDIIPTYEFVNGSLNISYSLQDNNYTYFWDLEKTPGNASDLAIALKFRINFRINYKFMEHNMSYSQNSGDLERIFFSNSTNATEYFGFNPAGQSLERIDVFLDVQIVEHCGYNIGGDRFKALFRFAELPNGFRCAVNYDFIYPQTCAVGNRITWTSPTNKLDTESIDYTLYSNNSVFYAISSPETNFTISNDTSVRPREEVNFTLTAQNFLAESSIQCSVDIIPTYEFVNGSLNISYSLQDNNFTYFWDLEKTPGNASDLVIALKFRINFLINYKFTEHNMSYSQNSGDLERIFFSNTTNATEYITFDQNEQTLERIDIFLNVQIVQHCGYNTSGNVSTDLFRHSESPTGVNCSVTYDYLNPYTCSVNSTITWTSPTNKLDTESIDYALYSNNSVFYTVSSPQNYFDTVLSDRFVRPRENLTVTLIVINFAGQSSSIQCSVEIIPSYQLVSRLLNISYSFQNDNFIYFWKLQKTPSTAFNGVIALIFNISFQIDYKFTQHNMSYSQNSGDLERIFFSNTTNSTESITFDQNGQTLERIDIFLNVQIVQQCGYNFSGDTRTYLFKLSEPPTGISCRVVYSTVDPYTCNVRNIITWNSPSNKLDAESLLYVLYANNSCFYSNVSSLKVFRIPNNNLVRPREDVNFTLVAANFAGASSTQCVVDLIPSFEFRNVSVNLTVSPPSNNISISWELMENSSNASGHILALTFLISLQFEYDFFENVSSIQTNQSMERTFLSNISNTNEIFVFEDGLTLEAINLTLNIQIVEQCGYSISGDTFSAVSNYTDFCDDMMCVAETDSVFNLNWNCSKQGVGLSRCSNSTRDATRECLQSGEWSEFINSSQCISSQFMSTMSANSSQNLETVLQVIQMAPPTYSGDVIAIVDVLEEALNATPASNNIRMTVEVVDLLVNTTNLPLLYQTQQISGISQRIFNLLEKQASSLVDQGVNIRLNDSRNVFFETKGFVTADVKITADNIQIQGLRSPSVSIPIFQNASAQTSVSVIVVKNIAKLITSFSDSITLGTNGLKFSTFSMVEIVTPMVSVQIFSNKQLVTKVANDTTVDLSFPLDLTQIDTSQKYFKPTCLFLANLTSNTPQWKDVGIQDVSSNQVTSNNFLTCNSGHTTAFVVLIGINDLEAQSIVLNILSYIGCTVAVICLLISLVIYILFGRRLLRKIYHFMHFQLALSLCLLYIVFLLGVELAYTDVWHYIPCKMVTVIMEYLLLVVFLLLFFESMLILFMAMWPSLAFTWKHSVIFLCIAWFLPIIYLTPFIPFFHEFYLSPPNTNASGGINYCWLFLDGNTYVLYTIVAPLALIVLANLIILIIASVWFVSLMIKKKLEELEPNEKTSLRLFAFITMFLPLVAFGWGCGFSAIYFNNIIFASLFTILCCLQGPLFLIFVLLVRRDIHRSIVESLDPKPKISKISKMFSNIADRRDAAKDPFRDNVYTQEPKTLPDPDSDLDSTSQYLHEKGDWRSVVRELEASSVASVPFTVAVGPMGLPTFSDESDRISSYAKPSAPNFISPSEIADRKISARLSRQSGDDPSDLSLPGDIVGMLSFYEEKPREGGLEDVEENSEDMLDKIQKDLDEIMTQMTEVEW